MTLPLTGSHALTAEQELQPLEDFEAEPDEEFIPKAPYRMPGLTMLLLACLVIGVGFVTGVLIQKHHDAGLTSTATNRAGAFAGGFGAGTGRAGGAGGAGFGGLGAGGTGAGGTGAAVQQTPTVIGTLTSLSATTAVVTNLGGAKIQVHLSKTTQITAPFGTAALKSGQSVSVYGIKAADGSVAATAVRVG